MGIGYKKIIHFLNIFELIANTSHSFFNTVGGFTTPFASAKIMIVVI